MIIGVIEGEVYRYIGESIGEYHRGIKGDTWSLGSGSNGIVRC